MATPAELSLAPFLSDRSFISMVVDSGATDNYVDPALTPGVRAYMCDSKKFGSRTRSSPPARTFCKE